MSLNLGFGFGVNRGALGALPDFALEFNGTDEYLQIALPSDLAVFDLSALAHGSTSLPANWTSYQATHYISTSESGSSKCIYWTAAVTAQLYRSGLTIGKKYKLAVRYKSSASVRLGKIVGNDNSYGNLITTSEWNTTTLIFTAQTTTFTIGIAATGTIYIESITIKEYQGFDLNKDQEMISHSRNALFNNAGTDWVAKDGSSNHTCALSTVDKAEGTGSNLITATGAGDATDHHVLLPSANIESVVSGKKYTLEGFARLDASSLTFSVTDKVITGDFSDAANWTISNATDFNVTGGVAVKSGAPVGQVYQGTAKGVTYTAGKVYKVVLAVSGLTGTVSVDINGGTAVSIATEATHTIYCVAGATATLGLRINGLINTLFTVDNISSFEATSITLTAQLGTKSVTSSALSIVAGTFTKFVLNFEATASEQSQDLKLYLSGAGSVYVDKLSLTQAYDYAVSWDEKVVDSGDDQTILGCNTSTGATSLGYFVYRYNSSNRIKVFFQSVEANANSTEAVHNDDERAKFLYLVNRTTTANGYKNGTLWSSVDSTSLSKIILTVALFIARGAFGATQKFKGQLSYLQIIRFENIAQSTFNSAITGLQYPTGGGAEEVLRLTFQSGYNITECLKDYSPKNHTVSGVNIDISNRKRVTA